MIQSHGYAVEREGFAGIENKTWVRLGHNRDPMAIIDDDGDLNVWIPRDVVSPVEIPRKSIHASSSALGDIVEHYLGEDGNVTVDWPS
ncbi:TPA: hypothetical protein DHU97_01510 [Candidatus Saccharibacteria bacterium]|nr:hypothetical protein [Candidatus Saccharibacteria bacterium]